MTFNKNTYYLILLAIIGVFISCEKDDVCLEDTTPNLIIRLYDVNLPDEIKPLSDLTLVSLPGLDTIYKNVSKDSLVIPLNVNENTCQFKMIDQNNTDIVQFDYTREDVFVSKTCGYKTIFHQLQMTVVSDADNWIQNYSLINNEITEESIAHVKIFH